MVSTHLCPCLFLVQSESYVRSQKSGVNIPQRNSPLAGMGVVPFAGVGAVPFAGAGVAPFVYPLPLPLPVKYMYC